MLRITHEAVHFSGGPCKFGRGLEVIGIFETEKEANSYIAYLDQNGVVIYDPPEPIREGELPEGQKPTFRVFLMLEELHRQGYEQLRIIPGMSASGMYYRACITPAMNVYMDHGAVAVKDKLVAANTSANGEALFEWDDAAKSSIPELAQLFVLRFPEIAELGHAPDPAYAAWFQLALACARRGEFPVAYDSLSSRKKTRVGEQIYLPVLDGAVDALAMPPPGLNLRKGYIPSPAS
jgi:hypothetical protein